MLIHVHRIFEAIFVSRSPVILFSINLAILLLLGWADVITGDYSLIVFYLIPVSLAAWIVSRRFGILFCFLAIAVRLVADEISTSFSSSHSMLHYWNLSIELLFLVIMSVLFSALKKNLATEKILTSHDSLTGALNRRSFFDLARHEINRSHHYALPFSIAYIDLDDFKKANESLGRQICDELLVSVVSTIRANIRNADMLARFGGDEFVILLPATSGESAVVLLNKIHRLLTDTVKRNNWPVTFSIGAVTCIDLHQSIDEVVQKADEIMNSVKLGGKNRLIHMELEGGQQ